MNIKSVSISPTEQPPEWYTPVTQELLRDITRRIVKEFTPERVILFGSYAYGDPTIHSDIDLLVITKKMAEQSVFARARAVSRLFPDRKFGMDILVRTPQEVRARLAIGDDFINDILKQGRILYEHRHGRRVGSRSRNGLQKRARSRQAA
jgi:predicted nucleotidyltransferase